MKLVLNDVQGEMKPVRRGFGKQYLVEHEDGTKEYVPEELVSKKLKNFKDIQYRVKKSKKKNKSKSKKFKKNKEDKR